MTRAQVVIGTNFGDEGKGLVTDYLTQCPRDNPIVVRFNGGAQAGHTVETHTGKRHVFSHFGSGSLNGVSTYLSKFFISNPVLFHKELQQLQTINIQPSVIVNYYSPLTTPYDMLINQLVEQHRGTTRHGSCGVGINETVQRHGSEFSTCLGNITDIRYARAQLQMIRSVYVPSRLAELGYPELFDQYKELFLSDEILENFISDWSSMVETVQLDTYPDFSALQRFGHFVFEGAQGLLLDQHHRWFPHVTNSNTGMANPVKILTDLNIKNVEIFYVTRCYLTRHGAGPLPFEVFKKPYKNIHDKTNIPNEFQGNLRFAPLNLDLLRESISDDLKKVENIQKTVNMVVTCIDQLDQMVDYVKEDRLIKNTPNQLINQLALLNADIAGVFGSFGPRSIDIERV